MSLVHYDYFLNLLGIVATLLVPQVVLFNSGVLVWL
jgi:hypothetical protein